MNGGVTMKLTLTLVVMALASLGGTPPAAPWQKPPEVVRVGLSHLEAPAPLRVSPQPPKDTRVDEVFAHLVARQPRTGLTREELAKLARALVETADLYAFDPELVLAVMHVESRFDAFAVSPKHALGLMQILPSTGEWMAGKLGIPWEGPQNLFDPLTNLTIGVAYLRELLDRYGDLETALAAYNWGPTTIDRRLARGVAVPGFYAGQVMDALQNASS